MRFECCDNKPVAEKPILKKGDVIKLLQTWDKFNHGDVLIACRYETFPQLYLVRLTDGLMLTAPADLSSLPFTNTGFSCTLK